MKKNLLCIVTSLIIGTSSIAQLATVLNFEGATNGSFPSGSLISDGTFLYGMTEEGGTNDMGTIFKTMPDGTGYVKLLDFSGTTNGKNPRGTLMYDGSFLYGITDKGGTSANCLDGCGTIFKIFPDGTGYVKLLDFEGTTNGHSPAGSLISDGTFLYGSTRYGGTNNLGTIFKIMPDGTNYVKLLDFAGTSNGRFPMSSLEYDGTFLYGMTFQGGTSANCPDGCGTIFKIMPDGTSYVKLLDFEGTTNGRNPRGHLISEGTFLYGMTGGGGVNNVGTIFRITPNGTGYTKLLDFGNTMNGLFPYGSLLSDGTFFYGMTYWDDAGGEGSIFKVLHDGTGYMKLGAFNGLANGSHPWGSLISDGAFLYGMTYEGGSNDNGVMFKFGLTANISESNTHPEFSIYPNPTTGFIDISSSDNREELVSISNLLGEVVWSKEINIIAGSTYTIDLTNEPVGIYFLNLGNSIERIIRK